MSDHAFAASPTTTTVPPGADKLREALERSARVHMVKCRHGHDRIERIRFKCDMMHVTVDPLDPSSLVSCPRSDEDGAIHVEAHDPRHASFHELR
jgi:hypothetical protein